MHDLESERVFATDIALEAGRIALAYFRNGVEAEYKAGNEPVTEADRAANTFIVDAIRSRFPDDAILAEESPPDPRRFGAGRTWMIDPIDGTVEFVKGASGWEVFVGLVRSGKPVLGVVHHPLSGTIIDAVAGRGTYVTRPRAPRSRIVVDPPGNRPLVVAVRQQRLHQLAEQIIRALDSRDIVTEGGFGARAVLALESKVDVVLSIGGRPKEWDTCATEVVLAEAGVRMVNCLGEQPTYLKPDPVQPHGLVIARSDIIGRILDVVVPLYRESQQAGA